VYARCFASARLAGLRCAHGAHHGRGIRKCAAVFLRDLLPVDPDRELTRAADDKLRIDPEILFELSRHPGGTWTISSGVAVANRDLHGGNRSIHDAPSTPLATSRSHARTERCEDAGGGNRGRKRDPGREEETRSKEACVRHARR